MRRAAPSSSGPAPDARRRAALRAGAAGPAAAARRRRAASPSRRRLRRRPGAARPASPSTRSRARSRRRSSRGGTWRYPLGTDRKGRDILSRVILGTRISLAVAVGAIALGGLVGTGLGFLAGYRGGWVDALIMRAADGFLAFPVDPDRAGAGRHRRPELRRGRHGARAHSVGALRPAGAGRGALLEDARLHRPRAGWPARAGRTSSGATSCPTWPTASWSSRTLQVGWAIIVEASLLVPGRGRPAADADVGRAWSRRGSRSSSALVDLGLPRRRHDGRRAVASTSWATGSGTPWTRGCGSCDGRTQHPGGGWRVASSPAHSRDWLRRDAVGCRHRRCRPGRALDAMTIEQPTRFEFVINRASREG